MFAESETDSTAMAAKVRFEIALAVVAEQPPQRNGQHNQRSDKFAH